MNRILFVDDAREAAETCAALAQEALGYEAYFASSVPEALALIDAYRPSGHDGAQGVTGIELVVASFSVATPLLDSHVEVPIVVVSAGFTNPGTAPERAFMALGALLCCVKSNECSDIAYMLTLAERRLLVAEAMEHSALL